MKRYCSSKSRTSTTSIVDVSVCSDREHGLRKARNCQADTHVESAELGWLVV